MDPQNHKTPNITNIEIPEVELEGLGTLCMECAFSPCLFDLVILEEKLSRLNGMKKEEEESKDKEMKDMPTNEKEVRIDDEIEFETGMGGLLGGTRPSKSLPK